MKHYDKENLYFSQLKHVVIDEVDTMIQDGFSEDLERIMDPVRRVEKSYKQKIQVLMATATLSKKIRKDVDLISGRFETRPFLENPLPLFLKNAGSA